MNKNTVPLISALCLLFIPVHLLAQCSDQLCQNLQNITTAAVTDYRGYKADKRAGPDLSVEGTKVGCQMNTWANNVSTYMCYAQVPAPNAQRWYAVVLDDVKRLNPSWRFQIDSPAEDHYVDAGPLDCDIPPNDGPYIGQCPLHLQVAKQQDGTMKIHFWMNSLSSPYLFHRPPAPVPKKPVSTPVPSDCDDLCQNLKKAFAARTNSFEDIRSTKTNEESSDAAVKLEGAKECFINEAAKLHSTDVGTQFVCHWSESSSDVAETRFRVLVSRIQSLVLSDWSSQQKTELDDSTGAKISAWYFVEPGGKHDVRVYLSGIDVGLHITTWN
jgi:hypothetical protein